MATRATYCFTNSDEVETYYYIHYDNYESGAAEYFKKMHQHKSATIDKKKDIRVHEELAISFIRGNENTQIEFTKNHKAHLDTVYHYDIGATGHLHVWKSENNTSWDLIFDDSYIAFIKQFSEKGE